MRVLRLTPLLAALSVLLFTSCTDRDSQSDAERPEASSSHSAPAGKGSPSDNVLQADAEPRTDPLQEMPFHFGSDSIREGVRIQFGPFALAAEMEYRLRVDWREGSDSMEFFVLHGERGNVTEFYHSFAPGEEVVFSVPEDDEHWLYAMNEAELSAFSLDFAEHASV